MSIVSVTAAPRIRLSPPATTVYAALVAITFSATSSAPTPLYRLYQETLGLSPLAITVIFAIYAFAMLAAFLTVARLSDHVGRRPMIAAALLLNALALGVFIAAGSASMLMLARVIQGLATGIALTTLGAVIVDTDQHNGATINSVTAFIGLTVGTLAGGALVSWAPLPTQLIYIALLALTTAELLILAAVPETAARKPGAASALIPRVTIPVAARGPMLQLFPLNLASWALGGFYLSLMPSLVAATTGVRSPFIGAAVVSALMLTGSIAVYALRRLSPPKLVRIASIWLSLGILATLAGMAAQSVLVMMIGTVVAGIGFGAAYSGNLRTLLPLASIQERAGLLSAYFVCSYLSFALPAIVAGLAAPLLGLAWTGLIYGAVLATLALASLLYSPSARI